MFSIFRFAGFISLFILFISCSKKEGDFLKELDSLIVRSVKTGIDIPGYQSFAKELNAIKNTDAVLYSKAVQKIKDWIVKGVPPVRSAALIIGGETNDPTFLPLIQQKVDEQTELPSVRASAVYSAGKMGELGIPTLQAAIQDPEPYVRGQAVYAVKDIGEKGLSILKLGLEDAELYVFSIALEVTEKTGEFSKHILRQILQSNILSPERKKMAQEYFPTL